MGIRSNGMKGARVMKVSKVVVTSMLEVKLDRGDNDTLEEYIKDTQLHTKTYGRSTSSLG